MSVWNVSPVVDLPQLKMSKLLISTLYTCHYRDNCTNAEDQTAGVQRKQAEQLHFQKARWANESQCVVPEFGWIECIYLVICLPWTDSFSITVCTTLWAAGLEGRCVRIGSMYLTYGIFYCITRPTFVLTAYTKLCKAFTHTHTHLYLFYGRLMRRCTWGCAFWY